MALIQLQDDDEFAADPELWASIDLAAARSRYSKTLAVALPRPEPCSWQQQSREPQDLPSSKRMRQHFPSSSMAPQQPVQAMPPAENLLQLAVPRTGSGQLWSGNEDRGGGEQKCSWMATMPSVELFRYYQEAALQILVPGDYIMLQGKPYLKKSGWRKIAAFYNISFEIKSKEIKFDQGGANVLRSEFIVRASMTVDGINRELGYDLLYRRDDLLTGGALVTEGKSVFLSQIMTFPALQRQGRRREHVRICWASVIARGIGKMKLKSSLPLF